MAEPPSVLVGEVEGVQDCVGEGVRDCVGDTVGVRVLDALSVLEVEAGMSCMHSIVT